MRPSAYRTMRDTMTSIARKTYGFMKRRPLASGLTALSFVFVTYVLTLRPWTAEKRDLQVIDFVVSIFTESIIIMVTVIVVKIFIEGREEENRDPVYQTVFEEAYRIYDAVYRLVYTMMADSLFRGGFTVNGHYGSEHRKIDEIDVSDLVSEFFRESGKYNVRIDKSKFESHLRNLHADVDDFLQYYAAFLTSDATEETGSRLLTVSGRPHIKSLSHQHLIAEAIAQSGPNTLFAHADL